MTSRPLTLLARAALLAGTLSTLGALNACDGVSAGLSGVSRTPSGLNALALSAGTLDPIFSNIVTEYTATVANAVTVISATPTVTTTGATVTVNDVAVPNGTASQAIPLLVGSNTVDIVVTNPDGLTRREYIVLVTRSPF